MPLSPAYQTRLTQLQYDHAALAFKFALIKLELAFDRAVRAEARDRTTTHYIWRTRGDNKVRASHATNNGKIFAWDNPPPTGHPGEDYGCRCWAEPIGVSQYARQLLITSINDNPVKWTNLDFVRRYTSDIGGGVTLQETGYLGSVIEYYGESLGVYDKVNQQIIDAAIANGEGALTYPFARTYNFGRVFSGIKYSFGDATVSGQFEGEARREDGFLIIYGIITYNFFDRFFDPSSKVERLMLLEGISRAEAESRVGESGDSFGKPYIIEGQWKTKFNGAVAVAHKGG